MTQSQIIRERYKIIDEIARGGMGVVYFAKDLLTNDNIALKISSWANEAQPREAFETEAKLLARLNHPGLPKVRDYFLLENNFQALVMDYIEGETLSEIQDSDEFRSGRFLHPSVVIAWTSQILDILTYLHGFSPPVIHRDIKPNNLKLKPDGTIVLLDFGLAKGSAMSIVGGGSGYSSLEQLNLVSTDPRSDLYSLGATVYHLLTNNVPLNAMTRFQAICGNGRSLLDKNPEDDPQKSVSEVNPQISGEISDVVMKAMSLFPEDRFQSAAEMSDALESARSGLTNLLVNFRSDKSGERSLAGGMENQNKSLFNDDEENLGVWASKNKPGQSAAPNFASSEPAKSEVNKTRLSVQVKNDENRSAETSKNDDFTTFEVSRPSAFKPVKKVNKKTISVVFGLSAIAFLFLIGIGAWSLFQPNSKPENSDISKDDQSVLLSSDKANKPMEIVTYLINSKGKETRLAADHLFDDGEEFRFGVKSDAGGYLYVISRNNQDKAQLAYPRPDQVDNSIAKNSESAFPPDNGKFRFNKASPSEMWAYFVVVSSRESELAKRIRVILGNNQEKSLSLPDVDKLLKDLDQIAEDSAKRRDNKTDSKEKVDVLITKLQKK